MTENTIQTKHVGGREFTILIAFLMSIVAISIDALLPSLGVIAGDFKVTNPNDIQYVISFIFIGMTIGQLICGPLSDALGRKKILYWGIGLYLIGSVICFTSASFEMLLIGRLIQGLGVSGPYVSSVSIVRDKFAGRDMARMMSLVMMIFMTVPVIAPSIGQAILLFASWREIFLLYIIYSIGIGTWIFMRLEETLPKENRIPFDVKDIVAGFKEVFNSRRTISYTICMGICFGSLLGYLNSSQQIFQGLFHTGKLFSLYFAILAFTLGVSSLMNSRFVQRLGMRYICVRSMLYTIVSSGIFLCLNLLIPIQLWMFIIYAAGLFFCFGLMFGNLNSLAMEPMGHIAGIASAVIGSISSAMSMILGLIIGQLYNNTLIPMTAGFFILGTLSLLAMFYAERSDKLP